MRAWFHLLDRFGRGLATAFGAVMIAGLLFGPASRMGTDAGSTSCNYQESNMSAQSDVKTIHEFLEDNPNVDVSKQWERCWNIHGKIHDRILNFFNTVSFIQHISGYRIQL